jgi:hypothetical protein
MSLRHKGAATSGNCGGVKNVLNERVCPVEIEVRVAPRRDRIATAAPRDAASAARSLNQQILRVADLLVGGADHTYVFSCECGCGATVSLTPSQYDERDCLAAGHRRSDSSP